MIELLSFTIKELDDNTSLTYLHRGERLKELKIPELLKVYANTAIFRVPSSKYEQNRTYWHVYMLFEDFKLLVKDKDITLDEAIDYIIDYGDVHSACDCPAYKYWAHEYYGTQLDYTYGPYRNNQAPTRNNTQMKSLVCKHQQKVFDWLKRNRDKLKAWFEAYYYEILKDKKIAITEDGEEPVLHTENEVTEIDLSADTETEETAEASVDEVEEDVSTESD